MGKSPTSSVEWFTVQEAARIVVLSVDMLNYLSRYGIVIASGSRECGRGRPRRYTFADLILLRAIAQLLQRGVSVLRLKQSLVAARKRGQATAELLSRRYLLTDGYNVYFQDSGSLELLETGQMAFAFVLELAGVRTSVKAGIERERAVQRA
jgi:DNA-binding transcriptional MerR regulator